MKNLQALCYSFSLPALEPMAYVRLSAPFGQAGIEIINGYQAHQPVEELLQEADFVLFQREFPMHLEEYNSVVALARQKGKPIVLELDDLLFFLPQQHPDKHKQYYDSALLPMFQALIEADLVTVSTLKMKTILAEIKPDVIALPNYFDDQLWKLRTPPSPHSENRQLTIGYMGTDSHLPDLELITPVLLDTLTRHGQINLIFWGLRPPESLAEHPQVRWITQKFTSYQDFAAYFQTQSADIFLAPLVDCLFNRCKSPIKFFEYSSLGAPGIYSRLEPYEQVVTHGETGFLASSLSEWSACLDQLISDGKLRHRMAVNAQQDIKEKYLLSKNASRWKLAFQELCETFQSAPVLYPKVKPEQAQPLIVFDTLQTLLEHGIQKDAAIQSLSTQIGEAKHALTKRDQNIDTLSGEVQRSKAEVDSLKNEVVQYAHSKSWRFTRPFRWIMRKLVDLRQKS